MKKTLLLLTGLLALSATAMAAEATVTAPATTTAPAEFKAHGSFGSYVRTYTNTSYTKKGKDGRKTTQDSYIRLNNDATVYVAPNTYIEVEQNNGLNYPGHENKARSKDYTTIDFNHSSGMIGSTELEFSQNVEFDRSGVNDTYEYAPSIDFSSYLGDGNTGTFELDFDHTRTDGTTPYTAKQSVGYDLDTDWDLGAGFRAEAELSGTFYGRKLGAEHKTTNTNNSHALDLGIYYNHDFYKTPANAISFYSELYMNATLSNSKDKGSDNTNTKKTSLSSETYVNFSHNINTATQIYLRPGLLLGKGLTTNVSDAADKSDFKRGNAQAYLRAGFSVTL